MTYVILMILCFLEGHWILGGIMVVGLIVALLSDD